MTKPVGESLSILGIPVSVFDSYDDALQLIRRRILSRQRTFCVAINAEKVYQAKHNARLSSILDLADVRLCDGAGISLGAMLLHRRLLARCTGIDLFLRLIDLSAEEGWKVFLLGASPQSNAAACRVLMNTYPSLRIVGRQDGYFRDSSAVVERINESGADLLFVAMGTPLQEYWISDHISELKTIFCMCIGGSLDVIGGAVRRAPPLFQKAGAEWLFRLILQPSRLGRQAVYVLFVLQLLRAMRHSRRLAP